MSSASTVSGERSVTRPTTKVPEQRWCAPIPAAYFRKRSSVMSSGGAGAPAQPATNAVATAKPRGNQRVRAVFIGASSLSPADSMGPGLGVRAASSEAVADAIDFGASDA